MVVAPKALEVFCYKTESSLRKKYIWFWRTNNWSFFFKKIQAEENKRLRELQIEQEEKLAMELAKLKHESLKDEKMRQQVRENRYLGIYKFHLFCFCL